VSVTSEPKTDGATITGIDIAGYLVKDPQAAIKFYRDVLGITPTESEERGAEFTLADGTTFGVWKPDDGETGGFVMFSVSDVHGAVASYRARGLQVSDVTETPVCLMAFTSDPEGNGIILHQRKSS
jgi:predicted enzyme related to lactoylglutathione lyase